MSVSGSSRTHIGSLLEQSLGMSSKAEDYAGARAKVGQVGEAKSGPVKKLSHCAHR